MSNQTILITGRGVALAFARQGAKVAVSARGEDQLEQVAGEIEFSTVVWEAFADYR